MSILNWPTIQPAESKPDKMTRTEPTRYRQINPDYRQYV